MVSFNLRSFDVNAFVGPLDDYRESSVHSNTELDRYRLKTSLIYKLGLLVAFLLAMLTDPFGLQIPHFWRILQHVALFRIWKLPQRAWRNHLTSSQMDLRNFQLNSKKYCDTSSTSFQSFRNSKVGDKKEFERCASREPREC